MSDVAVSSSTYLITGASGFLGAHLCKQLLDRGAAVHATSRFERKSHHPSLRWWQCELTDCSKVHELLKETRPEVIFHLAGCVSAASNFDLVLPTFHSLLTSTVNVLVAGTTVGCRRTIITGFLTEPERGHSTEVPSSPYAAAKWASTGYAQMFHKLYRTPVVILRPFMTYGPGQHRGKIIPHTILSLLTGTSPKLSSGQWKADWVYVDDVINGFMLAAHSHGIDGCTIDLGSGTLTSTREVVERLVNLINPQIKPSFGVVPERPSEQVRVADTVCAKETLDWKPATALDEGLRRTVDWYSDQPKLLREGLEV